MTSSSPRVTVVVPTFNTGRHLTRLVASLDQQSLPPEEFEVVLVDDGSTDGTETLVERIAAARPNVRTAHVPASGWPGKPRNVGLDLARGEYVYFVDHDDHLGVEALERMTDYAHAHGSDVVVGREVRIGRGPLAAVLFAENRPKTDISWGPLWHLLTPHKMFRRQFLLDAGIRFPEGPRRLEDHAFMVPAYFAASTISVLADYPCYYWEFHDDREHSSAGIDPGYYYPFLEEVVDQVEARTEPGPARDKLLAGWYQSKVLAFIDRSTARWEPERREELVQVSARLAATRFAGVDAYLPPAKRLLSHLLRAGRTDDVQTLADAIAGVTAAPAARRAGWEGDQLVIETAMTVRYADGTPVAFREDGDRVRWALPVELAEIPSDLLDVTEAIAALQVSALVHRRTDGTHYNVTVDGGLGLVPGGEQGLSALSGTVTVRVDALTADFGAPLGSGRWYLRISTGGLGMSTSDPLSIDVGQVPPPALLDGLPVVAYPSRSGNLALAVASRDVPLLTRALPRPGDVQVDAAATGSRLRVDLPRLHVHGDGRRPATLRLGGLPLRATLVAEDGSARVESWFSALPGNARLELDLDGARTPLKVVLDVAQDGTVRAKRPAPKAPGSARPPRPGWQRAVARVPAARRLAGALRRAVR